MVTDPLKCSALNHTQLMFASVSAVYLSKKLLETLQIRFVKKIWRDVTYELSFLLAFPKYRGNTEDLLDVTVSATGGQILVGFSKDLESVFLLMFTSK